MCKYGVPDVLRGNVFRALNMIEATGETIPVDRLHSAPNGAVLGSKEFKRDQLGFIALKAMESKRSR